MRYSEAIEEGQSLLLRENLHDQNIKKEASPPSSRTPQYPERRPKDEFVSAEQYEQKFISQISGLPLSYLNAIAAFGILRSDREINLSKSCVASFAATYQSSCCLSMTAGSFTLKLKYRRNHLLNRFRVCL